VLLGLYRIADTGCTITVTISVSSEQAADEHHSPLHPSHSASRTLHEQQRWFCGDLHCHTHHSDASGSVATLIRAARAQGLDFCAVTDHNTSSHLLDLFAYAPSDLLLIPGIEITTYRGHANVWGVRSWIEFRAHTTKDMRRIRDHARARGVLFSINHPKPGGPPWEYGDIDADAIEGWQAPWFLGNTRSLAYWEALLQKGKRPTLVGGSDKHQGTFDGTLSAYEVGTPTTWVYAQNLSEQAILEGIQRGHVYLSRNPSGPHLFFTAQGMGQSAIAGDEIKLCAGDQVRFCCAGYCPTEGLILRIIRHGQEWAQVPIVDQE
jgi:hypothetical protein